MASVVSVIVPIYSVEAYLVKCIEHILAQTYEDFELILVDDGSPDRCPQICDDYAGRDPRIRVVHKVNGGLSDARNAGLQVAKGDYIYFLDADDYIEHNLLELTVRAAQAHEADMVVFNYKKVDEEGRVLDTSHFEPGRYSLRSDRDRMDYMINTLLKYRIGWEAWGRLFRADFIRKHDLSFWDNKRIFAEDIGFSLYCSLYLTEIVVLEEGLYNYLIRDDSIMGVNGDLPRLSPFLRLSECFDRAILKGEADDLKKSRHILQALVLLQQFHKTDRGNYHCVIGDMPVEDIGLLGELFKKAVRELPSAAKMMNGRRLAAVLVDSLLVLASCRISLMGKGK